MTPDFSTSATKVRTRSIASSSTARKEDVISLGDPDGNTYDRQHRLIDCASVLRAIIVVTPDGKYTVLADHYQGMKLNSPNDVVIGPDGAIYFTDPTLDLVRARSRKFHFREFIASTIRASSAFSPKT